MADHHAWTAQLLSQVAAARASIAAAYVRLWSGDHAELAKPAAGDGAAPGSDPPDAGPPADTAR